MMKTNEVLETIKARRSVRVYDKKQVPSEDLMPYWRQLPMHRAACIMKRGILRQSVMRLNLKN